MIEVLRLHLFLVSLTVIEVVEVGDDDGDRQGDRQDTSDRAEGAHDLPPDSHGPEAQRKEGGGFIGCRPTTVAWNSFVPRLETRC